MESGLSDFIGRLLNRPAVDMSAGFPFIVHDGGRSKSKRPRQKNDCTVRCLSTATGLDYDLVYDMLADAGRKCSKGFDFKHWIETQDMFIFTKFSFPAKRGEPRMNPSKFYKHFPKGRYIVRTAKHVLAAVDGVLYDTVKPHSDRCIYTAWRYDGRRHDR
jgi:hypothetical protein